MGEVVLRLEGIRRVFRQAGEQLDVLRGIDLELVARSLVALVGPSGSGKSTLLHIAGLLERPSEGDVLVQGKSCRRLPDRERTRLRREQIGFVYQFHHLLPDFTAQENVMMPQLLAGRPKAEARRRADELLAAMGLTERASHRPGRLSGGEQQRVAIARALANRPSLVLADEPTGNLDPHTAEGVFGLLLDTVRGTGAAALIATHNPDLAARMDATWTLRDGRLDRLQAPVAAPPTPAPAV